MLILESFDDLENRREQERKEQLRLLEERKQELENVRKEAESKAYDSAFTEATENYKKQKESEIQELSVENTNAIKDILGRIESSAEEQSQHYASLLGGIIHHFLPAMTHHKSLADIAECITKLLKSCDKRQLMVTAHPKTLIYMEEMIRSKTRRVSLVDDDTMAEGKFIVTYDGGGADIDMKACHTEIVAAIENMLGTDFKQLISEHITQEEEALPLEDTPSDDGDEPMSDDTI
ncbi:MAG: hypothetical protein AAF621_07835 [Pseudomonadota bacterium]